MSTEDAEQSGGGDAERGGGNERAHIDGVDDPGFVARVMQAPPGAAAVAVSKLTAALRNAPPSIEDYKHLSLLRGQLARFLPDEQIDGHNVRTEFDQIDFTQPKNHQAYRTALGKYIMEQEGIRNDTAEMKNVPMQETRDRDPAGRALNLLGGWMDKDMWFGLRRVHGGEAKEHEQAKLVLKELYAAEREYADFTGRLNEHNAKREAKNAVEPSAGISGGDAVGSGDIARQISVGTSSRTPERSR